MDNSEKNSMPQIPEVPQIVLAPPSISQSYDMFHKRMHLMDINGQQEYGGAKQQVEKKLKKQLQRAQENSTQLESTGEPIKIDLTLYTLCEKCNKSVLISELAIHMSCHAAIILDNLLLGDKISASSRKELIERNKVTHVVNAAAELPNFLENEGLWDNLSEQLEEQMEKAYSFIKKSHEEGGIVFVHCAVGKSRSVSVILTYLLKEKGIGIKEGLKLVKSKRPIAQPNISYMQQLLEYEKKWLQQKTKNIELSECKINDKQQNSSLAKQSEEGVSN